MNDFHNYFFFKNQTLLSEGRFVEFPKYGQIIFLIGGAGSGKNFVLNNVIGHNGVNCDVDDLKTYIAREKKFLGDKYKKFGNEFLHNVDFKNPEFVAKLHQFCKLIFEPEGSQMESSKLDGLVRGALTSKNKANLPNIVLNITGKNLEDFERLAIPFVGAGYKPENIHIVWVLAPYEDAKTNNKNRSRTVPESILTKTHKGVKEAMGQIKAD